MHHQMHQRALGPPGTPLSADAQSCPAMAACLGQVRNPSPPWFGGEGATSMRSPNRDCRHALGLLLLDWSSERSTAPGPLVLSRWETLFVKGLCDTGLRWFVRRVAVTAPNAPKFPLILGSPPKPRGEEGKSWTGKKRLLTGFGQILKNLE